MQIPVIILSTTILSRVLRDGENKGQTRWSVAIYAHSGDYVPSQFVIGGLNSEQEAQAIASKYGHNTAVKLNYVPRDAQYINPQDLILEGKKG